MKGESRNKISDIFPILLFLVFTLSALGIVLASVQIYQRILEQAEENYDTETAVAYMTEKFRNHDAGGSIKVEPFRGHDAILIEESIKDVPYVTYIYAYGGYMRELFTDRAGLETCIEDSGNRILEMKDFKAEKVTDRLVRLEFEDPNGGRTETYLSLRSSGGDD